MKFEEASCLIESLVKLFPEFTEELNEDKPETIHQVLMLLTPNLLSYLNNATLKNTKAFCSLVSNMVQAGGVYENAVSTCLLEHASKIGVHKIMKRFLSESAKNELR